MAGGRPSKKRDERTAKEVLHLSQLGIPQDKIATVVGLSKMTLLKLYLPEIEKGAIDAERALTTTAFKLATDPKNPDRAMIMFLLKTRFGYRETERKEVELAVKQKEIKDMSDAELKAELDKYAGGS